MERERSQLLFPEYRGWKVFGSIDRIRIEPDIRFAEYRFHGLGSGW